MLPIRGRVYVVEPLGRQREVTVEIGENRVAIVTPREERRAGRSGDDLGASRARAPVRWSDWPPYLER